MKLLLLGDHESPYLWDYYRPGTLAGYDLILSSGDLNPSYLSFIVTMGRAPLLYVHGNHDGRYQPKYLIHSHVHLNYGHSIPRTLKRNNTTIINAYERFELDI